MHPKVEYLNFIKKNGLPVSEINPGGFEYALKPEDAIAALDILFKNRLSVAGGDILTIDANKQLRYAYQVWGPEYHVLNWSCDVKEDYLNVSHQAAQNAIQKAVQTALKLDQECLFVLIVSEA